MTLKEYAWAAVDIVVDLAAECGVKLRRGDFYVMGREVSWSEASGKHPVEYIGGEQNASGIMVVLRYDHQRTGKKLKACKDSFFSYVYCRVLDFGVSFNFSLNEIDIQAAGKADAGEGEMEAVIRKVQKLLALADESRNPSEAEAIAARA